MKHMSFHYELRISNNMAKTKLHICPYAYVYIDIEAIGNYRVDIIKGIKLVFSFAKLI